MNSNNIVRVCEENVDGCGSDAEIYVKFNVITPEIAEKFQKRLRVVKKTCAKQDFSTEDFVNEALSRFNTRIVHGEVISSPFGWEVSF